MLGYIRWNDEGSRVVVIVNLSGQHLDAYTIEGIDEDGIWHDWTNNQDVEVNGGTLIQDLPQFEARVFVKG